MEGGGDITVRLPFYLGRYPQGGRNTLVEDCTSLLLATLICLTCQGIFCPGENLYKERGAALPLLLPLPPNSLLPPMRYFECSEKRKPTLLISPQGAACLFRASVFSICSRSNLFVRSYVYLLHAHGIQKNILQARQ